MIASFRELDPDDLVCFAGGPASPDEPCLVIDSTLLSEDEDHPPEAEQAGLTTLLGKYEIMGVVDNLVAQQVENPDLNLILRAVAYYVANDAFLVAD